MALLFIAFCLASFMAAAICYKKSLKVDDEAERNRPEGTFLQGYVTKIQRNNANQTARVTMELVLRTEKISRTVAMGAAQSASIKVGKTLPVVYQAATDQLIINPGEAYSKKRNKLLAAAVALSLCGSYFAITIFPIITWQ